MAEFKVIQDQVLIKLDAEKTDSDGGIHLVADARFRQMEGTVCAVGPGKITKKGKFLRTTLEKGERVLLSWATGADLKINGEDYVITREFSSNPNEGILAVL